MDGPFWVDTRTPHNYASGSTVTLTATAQALVTPAWYPPLGSNYFNYVGKACRISAFGQMTTGATPGNITFQWLWGTGANNNGLNIQGVAVVGVANQTNVAWVTQMIIRCRSLGTSGTLFGTGFIEIQGTGILCIPPSAPSASTLDLTQNYIPSLQVSRSGSTAETVQLHELLFESLN